LTFDETKRGKLAYSFVGFLIAQVFHVSKYNVCGQTVIKLMTAVAFSGLWTNVDGPKKLKPQN
jgi:hypothetical protein